jgi:hypothetical protein
MRTGRLISTLSMTAIVVMTASVASAAGVDTGVAVPEPGTLSLLATGISGLAGAAWWLRRK